MKRALLFLVWFAPAAYGASWEMASFRTASGALVKPGMTMTEVLRDAGEPRERTVISHGIHTGVTAGATEQVWTYRGADGDYEITFLGRRVTGIVVIPDR